MEKNKAAWLCFTNPRNLIRIKFEKKTWRRTRKNEERTKWGSIIRLPKAAYSLPGFLQESFLNWWFINRGFVALRLFRRVNKKMFQKWNWSRDSKINLTSSFSDQKMSLSFELLRNFARGWLKGSSIVFLSFW